MREIPFIDRLGDRLEMAAAAERPARSVLGRLRRWSRRAQLLLGVAVVLAGGGVALAATTLSQSSTVLVARGLACANGTPQSETSQTFNVEQNGRTPQAACAAVLSVPVSELVVCSSARFGINVYERGALSPARECGSAGMSAGLPAGFAQATASVARVAAALNSLYLTRNCFTRSQLAAGAQQILRRNGYVGWTTVVDRTPTGIPATGRCAMFASTGAARSDAAASFDAQQHQLEIQLGPSRSVLAVLNEADAQLLRASLPATSDCTVASMERYVTGVLRAHDPDSQIRFAAFSWADGTVGPASSQARYDAGCPVFDNITTAPDGTTFLVALADKSRPVRAAGAVIPATGYTTTG